MDRLLLTSYLRGAIGRRLIGLGLNRRAVTAIEYALIAGLIAVIIVTAVTELGKNTNADFVKVAAEL